MKGQKVYLIRHAESEANVQKIVCGQLDSPLSQKGKEQAFDASTQREFRSLLNLQCYSSPLNRCISTAKLLGFKKIKINPELMETDTGDLSQRLMTEVDHEYPQFRHHLTDRLARYPKGETTQEMIDRAWQGFQNILLVEQNDFVIVTHGGPLNSICGHLLKINFNLFPAFLFSNVSLTTFVGVTEHAWSIQL